MGLPSQISFTTVYTQATNVFKAVKRITPRNFDRLRLHAPRPTFLLLHWTYILTTCLVSSVIFWHFSTPHENISYVDSLFLVVAAMTHTGLNTVNLSILNTFQQCLIFVHIICGNPIFISAFVVHVRKHAFHTRFKKEETERTNSSSDDAQPVLWQPSYTGNSGFVVHPMSRTLHYPANSSHNFRLRIDPSLPSTGSKISSDETTKRQSSIACEHDDNNIQGSDSAHDPRCICRVLQYSNTQHVETHRTIDRNTQLHSLSSEEREHLRCVEYQAVRLLGYVVPLYIIIWQSFGCVAIGAYMAFHGRNAAAANAVNPWWAGVFYSVAGFNNVGMSLLDLSVIPFQESVFFLVVLGLLMLAGNTAYPVFLRWILRATLYILPKNERYKPWRETVDFILKYPRRVYTHLFPSGQTWWLALLLLVFNAIDWTAFEVLNRYNPSVTVLPLGYRLLDGLFQSLAVRSSGFAVIPINSLAVGLQALYIMMMYISAFPVAITMRNSNVYEERSLGIYADDIRDARRENDFHNSNSVRRTRMYFLCAQVQRQLGHDLWFVIVCMIIIVWIETESYNRDPIIFSTFSIIFEVVSAYGCVGLSIGLPNQAYSFCGAWRTSAKLILCALMLRGRHRGLPVAIDKAIQLPGEKEELIEERDHEIREVRAREGSRVIVERKV